MSFWRLCFPSCLLSLMACISVSRPAHLYLFAQIDISVFRTADYTQSKTPYWRFCNLEDKEGFADDADLNEYNNCLTPEIRNDWVSQGMGAYVDVPDENGTSTISKLEWCCTTEAVRAGLCEVIHFGRMLVNQTAFNGIHGNHRFIPIARVSEVETALTHGKLIQPHEQGGTYVVIIANCNPHGRPIEVVGPWTWIKEEDDEDGLYSNITTTGGGSGSNSSTSSGNNETTGTGAAATGNPTSTNSTHNDLGNTTAALNETQVPAPSHSTGHAPRPTTSSSSSSPQQAPISSGSPSLPKAPLPTHVPHATSSPPPIVSGGGGGSSSGGASLGAKAPISSSSNTNNNSNNNNKAGGVGIAILSVVAIVGFIMIRKRLGRTHSLVGSDGASGVHFDDLEMVENRKEEHFTDFGDNHGYMPNFS
jgi:hypothetical protein